MDFSKPRVALYYYVVPQTNFRNDGPPLFLNAGFRRALNGVKDVAGMREDMKNDGGNVVHLWPNKENLPEKFGKFDLHVLVDHGEDALNVPLDWELPHPSAYWVSDAHLGYDYRLERARQFDYVFCCQSEFIARFKADGIDEDRLFYLPHAVEPTAYFYQPSIERWDWAFIGHLNSGKRIDFLDRMIREFPSWYLGWRDPNAPGWNVLENAALKYSQAKVIVNDAVKNDLNMRVFEAMSTGRTLLTERVTDIGLHFKEGLHYEGYETHDEAVEKMKRLLADEKYRTALAQNGRQAILAGHTYDHRVRSILKTCLKYDQKEPQPCLSAS